MPCVDAPLLVHSQSNSILPNPTSSATSVNHSTVCEQERVDCMRFPRAPAKVSVSLCSEQQSVRFSTASPQQQRNRFSTATPQVNIETEDMNPACNPHLTQGHPIDDFPTSVSPPRSSQQAHFIPETDLASSEFGPYVTGGLPIPDDFRQRSSSFNNNILTRHRTQHHTQTAHTALDPLRRFSESQSMTRTGSADNVIGHHTNINRLRHSQTISEIPPHALSNDSGYITPPNRQHVSPPWPPNSTSPQWPNTMSPNNQSSANIGQTGDGGGGSRQRNSAPLPLTIETGHYQPEPASPPQLLVGQPVLYQSMQPLHTYNNSPGGGGFSRQRDPYSSLQTQSSGSTVPNTPQTPEEGVLMYQRERKNRLVSAFQQDENDLHKLKDEEHELLQMIQSERDSNNHNDSTMEKEVEGMKSENQRLALQIQRLMQMLPNDIPSTQPAARPNIWTSSNPNTPPSSVVPGTPLPPVGGQPPPQRGQPLPPYPVQPMPYPVQPMPYPVQPNYTVRPTFNPPTQPTAGSADNSPTPVRRTPVPAPRPTASPIQTEEIPDSVKWACALCTYLNHPLIKICEMCETHRPNLQGR